jgi:prepilin-type N-terminal cleavage/methylation domain-containing protein
MDAKRRTLAHNDDSGFTLVDMIATLAVISIVSAIAVPAVTNSFENQRLGIEVRNVERELQTARLAAVGANRPIRIRFNCPVTGQYRRVELLGTVNTPAADDADTRAEARCNYPAAPDTNPLTRPNHDGRIQRLHTTVSFAAIQTLEFWPNGTVHTPGNLRPLDTPVTLTLSKGSTTKSISVNSLGKIRLN